MSLYIAKCKPKNIGTLIVQIPSVFIDSYTYNGTPQGPTITGLEDVHCNVTNASNTNAGTYTLTISLKDSSKMVWEDLTIEDKTYEYTIAKAAGSLTISKNSVTLNSSNLTDIVTVSDTTGTLSVSSSDSTIATASVSGNTVTISNVNKTTGTATITISVAENTNYLGTSATVSVSCEFISTVLENNSWETIANVGAEGMGSSYWSVGDTKTITLNGTVGAFVLNNFQCKVFIIDFNYRGDNGIYFQGFKSTDSTPIDIALCGNSYGSNISNGSKLFNMSHWGNYNYGGWKGCDLRYDILGSTNTQPSGYGATPTTSRVGYDATSAAKTSPVSNTLIAALPNDLRSALAPWTIYTDNKGNSSNTEANVTTSVDYLPLLAEYEIYGSRTQANQYENTNNKQNQMTYYTNGNSNIKYNDSSTSSAVDWWVRSARYANATSFCRVRDNGASNHNNASYSRGLAPAFRIA